MFKAEFESYRQGDVILRNMGKENLPENLTVMNTKIIAESFTTGHTHEFIGGDVEFLYNPEDEQSPVFLNIKTEALLAHQEHALHMVKPGCYEVRFQQTVIDNEPIRVID